MSNDLVALKILVVSDSGPDRLALRDAAARASVPVDVSEANCTVAAACLALTGDSFDVVLIARQPLAEQPFDTIVRTVNDLFRRAELFKEETL